MTKKLVQIEKELTIDNEKVTRHYFKSSKSMAKIIKIRLDEIVEERLKDNKINNSYKITNETVKHTIEDTYKILKRNTKEMEIYVANLYSKNLGVENKKLLNRGINKNRKNLKKAVLEIYKALNEISAFLRGTENTDYIFYYQDDEGNYYRKVITDKEIGKYYTVNKNDADNFISSYKGAVDKAFNGVEVISEFSEHLNWFYQAAEEGLKGMDKKIESGQMGFLYESFEWHLNKMKDNIEVNTGKNGQVTKFYSHHHNENWFLEKKNSIAKSFLLSIGRKRWIAGGDVLNHQLKSSGTFGVSSLTQLETSASMLFNFCDKIINKNNELTIQDIKNMVLFLNDIHNDLSYRTVEEIDEKINNALDNMLEALQIKNN